MARENISYEEARTKQVESIAAKRLGDPKEFGATCAFLQRLCRFHVGPKHSSRRRLVSGIDMIV
ncbi:hypothetical protein ACF1BQ_019245 [Bradyrhizobium sp. RDT10]